MQRLKKADQYLINIATTTAVHELDKFADGHRLSKIHINVLVRHLCIRQVDTGHDLFVTKPLSEIFRCPFTYSRPVAGSIFEDDRLARYPVVTIKRGRIEFLQHGNGDAFRWAAFIARRYVIGVRVGKRSCVSLMSNG